MRGKLKRKQVGERTYLRYPEGTEARDLSIRLTAFTIGGLKEKESKLQELRRPTDILGVYET